MITGECFCGEVRYEIDGPLVNGRACHCSRCRKVFSGASSAFADLSDTTHFRWVAGEDKVKEYVTSKGWGLAFCYACAARAEPASGAAGVAVCAADGHAPFL